MSVYVGPIAINKSTTVRPRKRAADGVSKEHQQVFVVGLSEAVGVDLWLDGHFVRGEVDDTATREGCQARLEEQVSYPRQNELTGLVATAVCGPKGVQTREEFTP